MPWRADAPEGNESAKIKYYIVPYTRGKVLELGGGPWKTYQHFISVDNYSEWQGLRWKPDILGDASNLELFASNSFDALFSSHLLEHIDNYIAALQEWWRVIKVGGHLVLYLPHKQYYPNIGDEGANPDHRHDFDQSDIINAMKANAGDWDLMESEVRSGGDEYSFFQVFRKLSRGSGQQYSYCKPKAKKTCGIVRYGGFGDMLQMSCLLPGLKRQGYHISVITTPRGHDIIKTDPNIDEFIIQDDEQVPNPELTAYWDAIAPKYDTFINLSESVEGTFLAMHGRAAYTWPHAVRHQMMNKNYTEFAFAIAGIDFSPERPPAPQAFYPTDRERRIAEKERKSIVGKVILWCLAGSSLHKTWPYLDAVIAEFMIKTDVHFVLCGDEACKLLEQGWENEPRVHRRSGKWSIRETLAFAQLADLVIGPETGVLNAVSGLDIPKVLFLSHSSEENLTKYWRNTIALTPPAGTCPCYPCHMLHHGFEHCPQHEATGLALCQSVITPPAVMQAIVDLMPDITIKNRVAE